MAIYQSIMKFCVAEIWVRLPWTLSCTRSPECEGNRNQSTHIDREKVQKRLKLNFKNLYGAVTIVSLPVVVYLTTSGLYSTHLDNRRTMRSQTF